MSGSVHISSLVVQTKPERLTEVRDRLADMGAEIPASDPCGKLVVVIETESEAGISGFLHEVATSDGVLSANLVYHLVDGEEAAEAPPAAGASQQQGETS
ncbi:chaperone NapD [Limibacillus halophilus]